jgi:hypothetical protein
MLWFFYVMLRIQTRTHKQNFLVRAALEPIGSASEWRGSTTDSTSAGSAVAAESTTEWRGSITDSAGAGSAHSWKGRTGWITVRNCLSSMKNKVADGMADKHNECWWGQWQRLTPGHASEYEIVQGLWSSCLAKDVAKPVGIWWVDKKWKGWTLQKLYSSTRSISVRTEAEGDECSYEDHFSCLEEVQE